jgi:phosphate-selective porin OprO and OprP
MNQIKMHSPKTRSSIYPKMIGSLACALSAAAYAPTVHAADSPDPKPDPSIFDKIWSYTDLYKNEKNPVVQRVQFTGRFQLDYALVDADQGDHDEWNIRRFRMGAKAKLFQDFTLHGEVDLNPQEPRPMYTRLTDAYLSWSRSKTLVATIGKHSAPFTMDGSTSSKELIAIDRSNLANNLWFSNEYFPGVSVAGQMMSGVIGRESIVRGRRIQSSENLTGGCLV